MQTLKSLMNRSCLRVNVSARCMSQNTMQSNTWPTQREWRLPQTDQDFERFLMKWTNVQGDEFLMSVREQCIKYGTQYISDKQKNVIKQIIDNPRTKLRRALYPNVIQLDPIMKRLLLLTEADLKDAEFRDRGKAEMIKELRGKLCDNGCLTSKQLMYAGSVLHQLFDKENKD